MELSADDLVILELLRRRGGMSSTQLHMLGLRGTALEMTRRLHGLAALGLLETRVSLYVITDVGVAALRRALAERAQALADELWPPDR